MLAGERCKPWPTLPSLAVALGEQMAPFCTRLTPCQPCFASLRPAEHHPARSARNGQPRVLDPRAGPHFYRMEGTISFFNTYPTTREEGEVFIWARSIRNRTQFWWIRITAPNTPADIWCSSMVGI